MAQPGTILSLEKNTAELEQPLGDKWREGIHAKGSMPRGHRYSRVLLCVLAFIALSVPVLVKRVVPYFRIEVERYGASPPVLFIPFLYLFGRLTRV